MTTQPDPDLRELAPLARLIHDQLNHAADQLTAHVAAYMGRQVAGLPAQLAELEHLRTEVERLRAAVQRVRDLHQPIEGLGYDCDEDDTPGSYGRIAQACTACGESDEFAVPWPCATVRALDAPAAPAAQRTPCSQPNPCEDGEPCGVHEVEQAHAEGDHEFCGPTCEVRFPSGQLRNAILARAIPGSARMLDELLRRAAAGTSCPAAPTNVASSPAPANGTARFVGTVQGRCPACGGEALFLGEGGYVTCRRLDCPQPDVFGALPERPTVAADRPADDTQQQETPRCECGHTEDQHGNGDSLACRECYGWPDDPDCKEFSAR